MDYKNTNYLDEPIVIEKEALPLDENCRIPDISISERIRFKIGENEMNEPHEISVIAKKSEKNDMSFVRLASPENNMPKDVTINVYNKAIQELDSKQKLRNITKSKKKNDLSLD